jgi:hypothetical protein
MGTPMNKHTVVSKYILPFLSLVILLLASFASYLDKPQSRAFATTVPATPITPPDITPSPTSTPSGSFTITNYPSNLHEITCVRGQECQFYAPVIFENVRGQNLYNTLARAHAAPGQASMIFNGVEVTNYSFDQVYEPGTGPNILFSAKPDPRYDTSTARLIVDGQVCNFNTNPADCYYLGGAVFTVKFTMTDPTPTPTTPPTPTASPSATPTPKPIRNIAPKILGRNTLNLRVASYTEKLYTITDSDWQAGQATPSAVMQPHTSLPAGLHYECNPSSSNQVICRIYGTPLNDYGTNNKIDIVATDHFGATRTKTITVNYLVNRPPVIKTTYLKTAKVGQAYTQNIVAVNYESSEYVGLEAIDLPAGLSLDPKACTDVKLKNGGIKRTCQITGIPTQAGTYPVTLRAVDTIGFQWVQSTLPLKVR